MLTRICRYAHPNITGLNYEKFIKVICPTVTHIRHSPLAGLIKTLDLSQLLYEGKASYTARLLRRCAGSIEKFIAPTTHFGYACMVALGSCHKLQLLDLRLVSQSIVLHDLFQATKNLRQLRTLLFPRSLMATNNPMPCDSYSLPEKLERFSFAGSIPDAFLTTLSAPETLTELRISHAFARASSFKYLLNKWSQHLRVLEINYNISTLPHNALDKLLFICPYVIELRVAVDYISYRFFDEDNTPHNHPLYHLDLDSSGYMGAAHKLKADNIFICLAEGRLPYLRILRISERLNWRTKDEQGVEDLVEVLESRKTTEDEVAGVWEFGTTSHGYGPF